MYEYIPYSGTDPFTFIGNYYPTSSLIKVKESPESSNQRWPVDGLGPGRPPMARKIRVEYAGAAYNVMARGNQGRKI
jgi:hypothetical protein